MRWGGSMKAVIKIAINNIMKKKLQNILILFIIIIAATLFSTSFNLISSINKPFEETHEKLNGFDNSIYIDPAKEDVNKILNIFRNNKEVKEAECCNCYSTNQYATINGKQIKEAYRIEDKEDKNKGVDKLITLEGDNGISPKNGEVWVSKDVADNCGIKLNDVVEFNIDGKIVTRKVGALVVDPGLGSASMGICRFWVGSGELSKIIPKNEIIKNISVVLKKHGDGNDVNLSVENAIGRPIVGYSFKYSQIRFASTAAFQITGEVLLVIAIFILIFTFVIIMITIANSILNDYKNIGIESSIGFTKFQIMMNYILHFLILSLVASVAGVIIGTKFSTVYLQKYYTSLGFAEVSIPIYSTSIITILTISLFVLLSALISSLSIFKISPVEAIREGNSPVKEKGRSSVSLMFMKKLNLSFSLSIKSLINNIRQNLLLFLVISVSIYITAFCINTRVSLINIDKDSKYWGLEKSDISLILKADKDNKEVLEDVEEIKKDARVKLISNLHFYSSISIPKTDKIPSESAVAVVYDNNFDSMELENIKGENPKSDEEITISTKISEKYGKKIGDYFTIYINGKKESLLISGIYQSIFHAGESIRLKNNIIENADSSFKNQSPTQSSILVKSSKDIPKLLNDLKSNFGNDYEIKEGNQYLSNVLKSSFQPVNIVLLIIIESFIIVTVFCIFNLNLINIYGYKKDLGIYKALGFTEGGIIKIYVYKILLLIIISILSIIPIEKMTQSYILSGLLSGMGIRNLPLPMCYGQIGICLCVFIVIIEAAVIISCRVIANINGRELISE